MSGPRRLPWLLLALGYGLVAAVIAAMVWAVFKV
jgi:uncharacterized protein involved in exopolysaccharide biosynthesis